MATRRRANDTAALWAVRAGSRRGPRACGRLVSLARAIRRRDPAPRPRGRRASTMAADHAVGARCLLAFVVYTCCTSPPVSSTRAFSRPRLRQRGGGCAPLGRRIYIDGRRLAACISSTVWRRRQLASGPRARHGSGSRGGLVSPRCAGFRVSALAGLAGGCDDARRCPRTPRPTPATRWAPPETSPGRPTRRRHRSVLVVGAGLPAPPRRPRSPSWAIACLLVSTTRPGARTAWPAGRDQRGQNYQNRRQRGAALPRHAGGRRLPLREANVYRLAELSPAS